VTRSEASTEPGGGIGSVLVGADEEGIRVDRWFKRHFPALGHGLLEKLLRTGQVRLDGKRVKAGDRLSTGQILRLPPQVQTIHSPVDKQSPDSQTARPQLSEQERIFAEGLVIHQDSAVLVLNKPAGLATQGGSGITRHIDGLLDYLTFGKKQRPRLVHRLDRDTSGVLVVARTVPAAAALSEALRQRDAQKLYWALTRGVPKPHRGTIKAALAKESGHGPHGQDERMATVERDSEGAKYAITDYAVLDQAAQDYAWVAAKPYTGRTHQIRVHLASLETPIVGDFKYGGTAARPFGEIADKLHLHARSIDIAHPDGGRLQVTAPLSPHMAKTWTLLGFDSDRTDNPFAEGRKGKRA
jgi:23S rRNA pseudouridine955/2504/2580 synthase